MDDARLSNRLFTAVSRRVFPDAEIETVCPLLGGVSASVHRLNLKLADGTNTSLVLRILDATGPGLEAETEYKLLKALHREGIPMPMPLHVEASGTLSSNPFLVMEFVEGSTAIPEDNKVAGIEKMADMLVRIHNVSTRNLPELPARINPLPEVLDYLPSGGCWDKLRRFLSSLSSTVYQGSPVLLHGDFWPENLIWRNDDIAAVLDWEDAALGDPISDVACCQLEIRYKYGVGLVEQFTSAYFGSRAVNPARLALWQVYVAASAQHFMGEWGLAQELEAHMRKVALESLQEAAGVLMGKSFQ